MKKIISITLLFFGTLAFSQENLNYPTIDKDTYEYYLKSDWDSLIEIGNKSLDAGIDFYYLQVRMGVAYYWKTNYRKAICFFEKAVKTNPKDEFVLEYLYKSYLYGARPEDARVLSRRFSNTLKNKLEITENPIFSSVYVETKFDNWDDYTITTTDKLEQIVKDKNSYYSVNFQNLIQPDIKLFWGYTRVDVDNIVHKLDENNVQLEFLQEVNQNQLYFSYTQQYAKGNNFTISLNYIYSNLNDYDLISGRGGFSRYGYIDVYSHDFALNLALNKDISNFKFGFNTVFSSLNESLQIQPGLDITYYPMGNTNLYLKSEFIQQFDFLDNDTRSDYTFKQSLGFRLKTVYIEPYISWGKLANFTRSNAFVIFNDDDFIQDEMGGKLYAYLLKNRLTLYTEYKIYDRINYYEVDGNENNIIYNNQTIIGGIKWNF